MPFLTNISIGNRARDVIVLIAGLAVLGLATLILVVATPPGPAAPIAAGAVSTATPSVTAAASPSLPPGIAESQARQIAGESAPSKAIHVSSEYGRYADVYRDPGEVLEEGLADRVVWAIGFQSIFEICPPDGSSCIERPGVTTVILDYVTGDWIASYGFSPAP